MGALLFFLLRLLVSPFRSISRLEAENSALRRQLIVLQRQVLGRVQFTNSDRLFFLQLYRWFPSIVKAMTSIRPETLVRGIMRDLLVVPSIGFDLLYALVIVRLARRDLVWINVTTHPTADWIAG